MLSAAFLDDVKARTSLSALIGRSVKIVRKGGEWQGLCPFHSEKTPSFYVNDAKAFYTCFGCGAHGDAIRWLTDHDGLDFIGAVKALADAAGLAMPARSAEAERRDAARASVADVLAAAGDWYEGQLDATPAALALLARRGVSRDLAARFGLGFAPAAGLARGTGLPVAALAEAGLMVEGDNGWRERFRRRLMIPIHDARGRAIGFGGRAVADEQTPKYLNSADSDQFDKGRTLYNFHRAQQPARRKRRLVIVEGYFDVIAFAGIGIDETVAPMGTALTEAQLERAWAVANEPILLFDGDAAGRRAAFRACERAMPALGPGKRLRIGLMPAGMDPDDLARRPEEDGGGARGVEAVLGEAVPLARFVFDAVAGKGGQ